MCVGKYFKKLEACILGLFYKMRYNRLQKKKELKILPSLKFSVSLYCHDRCDAQTHNKKEILLYVCIIKCDKFIFLCCSD